jgi:hypothetical protein
MRILRVAALALALAPWIVFLAGCGGSGERSDTRQDTRTSTRTEDRVENRRD